jgi:hypothetical protein
VGTNDNDIAAQASSPKYRGNPEANNASIGGVMKVIAMPKVVATKASSE